MFRTVHAQYTRPHLTRAAARLWSGAPAVYVWRCADEHHAGYGRTPLVAYRRWVTDVQFQRFASGYLPAPL